MDKKENMEVREGKSEQACIFISFRIQYVLQFYPFFNFK